MTRNGLKKIFELGILNTIRMNYHYFGVKAVFCPYIICSKYMKIQELKGEIVCKKLSIGCVKIGFKEIGFFDPKNQRAVWQNRGKIVFDGRASLGSGTKISNSGVIHIGDNVSCSGNSSIICKSNIEFQENCLISWECLFMDTDLHNIVDSNGIVINDSKEILIGKNVWFGNRCTVLKGTTVPNNTVVAAGSILTKSFVESNCVISSNKILKRNINWIK